MSDSPARRASPADLARYLGSRLGQAIIILWAAYTVSFLVLYALPSDPVALLAGGDATDITPEQLDALRAQYGLDKPLWAQYLTQLGAILTGSFGSSIATGRPVADAIGEAIGPTAQLAGLAFVLALVVGGGLAIAATFVRTRWVSSLLLSLPPLGVAIPSFWFGLMLIQWFSFQLPWFPAMGAAGFAALVLPAIALALPTSAMIAQLLSKSLRITLAEPYIDTAWAKGASRADALLGRRDEVGAAVDVERHREAAHLADRLGRPLEKVGPVFRDPARAPQKPPAFSSAKNAKIRSRRGTTPSRR